MTEAAFVGVDWGSTHVRAWAFNPSGIMLARRSSSDGVATQRDVPFDQILSNLVAGWTTPQTPILLAGMVGSKQGWLETPYLGCPARIEEVSASAVRVPHHAGVVSILPGLRFDAIDGSIDLMRGEEVQVWGAGLDDALVVLPGTHSKWATVVSARIVGFSTYLTGELFATLRRDSLVGRGMGEPGVDDAAFEKGVVRALDGGALARLLFGVRSEVLTGGVRPEGAADFLSGVLIGAEIGAERATAHNTVTIIGAPVLTERYRRAFKLAGVETVKVGDGESAAQRGLANIFELAQGNFS